MRLNDGRYECVLCGAVLDVPLTAKVVEMIVGSSGQPNMRRLSLDGKEFHSCEASPAAVAKTQLQSAKHSRA